MTNDQLMRDEIDKLRRQVNDLARERDLLKAAAETLPFIRLGECVVNTFLILPEKVYTIPGDVLTDIINASARIKEALNDIGPTRPLVRLDGRNNNVGVKE